VTLLVSVSIAEEIFFRGFLLQSLIQRNRLWGILLSGFVFALFHCVNFLHTQDYLYVWMQSCVHWPWVSYTVP